MLRGGLVREAPLYCGRPNPPGRAAVDLLQQTRQMGEMSDMQSARVTLGCGVGESEGAVFDGGDISAARNHNVLHSVHMAAFAVRASGARDRGQTEVITGPSSAR
eukprot:5912416-Pyramimonas_sp.AAC.1